MKKFLRFMSVLAVAFGAMALTTGCRSKETVTAYQIPVGHSFDWECEDYSNGYDKVESIGNGFLILYKGKLGFANKTTQETFDYLLNKSGDAVYTADTEYEEGFIGTFVDSDSTKYYLLDGTKGSKGQFTNVLSDFAFKEDGAEITLTEADFTVAVDTTGFEYFGPLGL